jgi:hypothetical protein
MEQVDPSIAQRIPDLGCRRKLQHPSTDVMDADIGL